MGKIRFLRKHSLTEDPWKWLALKYHSSMLSLMKKKRELTLDCNWSIKSHTYLSVSIITTQPTYAGWQDLTNIEIPITILGKLRLRQWRKYELLEYVSMTKKKKLECLLTRKKLRPTNTTAFASWMMLLRRWSWSHWRKFSDVHQVTLTIVLSSVDSYASSILPPRVRIPSTPSMLKRRK